MSSNSMRVDDNQPAIKKAKMDNNEKSSNGSNMNGNTANGETGEHFDHNLYSRQLYAIGHQAMIRLRAAHVLISGIGGVGVEIAKNLILGGVKHVTIHDTKKVTFLDLSSQYYLNEEDIGENRAEASLSDLDELNDGVTVESFTQPLNKDMIKKYNLVILTDSTLKTQLQVNKWTREAGAKFMICDTRGLFGMIFNDFGSKHQVDDTNGEQPQDVLIEHIDKKSGEVTTLEHCKHPFEDGDFVTFKEIKGMTQLNDIQPIKVTVKSPSRFSIGEVAQKMSDYLEGGNAKQVKMPKIFEFKSLEESLEDPMILESDFAKFERQPQFHILWQALSEFVEKNDRLPMPKNKADATKFVSMANKINEGSESSSSSSSVEELNNDLAMKFAYLAMGNLCPMSGFIGGVAAQEAMKAVTGIYTPIRQFCYFDALECLPEEKWSQFPYEKLTEQDCKPKNSRFDGQAAVFGWAMQEFVSNQNWFIVGAGAIGCELIKNFAQIGIGCGSEGSVIVTDMDFIEMSNLNRQFLFRKHDIGSKKSECAAKAARNFNPKMNIKALCERVGGDTEHIFSDEFFENLHGVANALDNVEARTYMDRRCVFYKLPLLESGTMGPKGNTQVVFPHLTESYSSSQDPPEKSIPICTLKNFPHAIEHTIQWARDAFEGLFTNPAEQANQFLEDPRAFLERLSKMNTGQKVEQLLSVQKALIGDKPANSEQCIKWARQLLQDYFIDSIRQLLFNFPAERLTDQGAKFWSGTKRCPKPIIFDKNDSTQIDFIVSASIMRQRIYGMKVIEDPKKIMEIASEFSPPLFEPRKGIKIALTDAEAQESQGADADDSTMEECQLSLAKVKGGIALKPEDFEKDDDTNYHMKFVTATSNLRANNYAIEKADFLKTKQIAGRIIPAIATTTAAVSGLVTLELYKIIAARGGKECIPMDKFKNGFLNLALPLFAFSEPIEAPKKKYGDNSFTLWDSFELKSPMTLDQLMKYFETNHGLSLNMLSAGVSLLYSFFMPPNKQNERKQMELSSLIGHVTGKVVPSHAKYVVLEPMLVDKQDEDVDTPYVRYIIK